MSCPPVPVVQGEAKASLTSGAFTARHADVGQPSRPAMFAIKIAAHPLQTKDAPLTHDVERRLPLKG